MGNAHGHTPPPRHLSAREVAAFLTANRIPYQGVRVWTRPAGDVTLVGAYPGAWFPGETPATVERVDASSAPEGARELVYVEDRADRAPGLPDVVPNLPDPFGSRSPMGEVRGVGSIDGLTGLVARHVTRNRLR